MSKLCLDQHFDNLTCPAGEFFWSFSKWELFNRCRRAYFLRYHAAVGGWREDAEAWCRELYRRKRMVETGGWLADMAGRAVRSTLPRRAREMDFAKTAELTAKRLFDRERRSFLAGKWRDDPKEPNLFPSEIDWEAEHRRLTAAFAELDSSGVAAEIADTGFIKIKTHRNPLVAAVDGIPVYCAPDVVWDAGDGLDMFGFSSLPPGTALMILSGVWALVGAELFRKPVDRIRVRILSLNAGAELLAPEPGAAEMARAVINDGLLGMNSVIDADGAVKSDRCHPSESADCAACPFR